MSLNPHTLEDLPSLVESVELECKLAQGQDGKGELPKDFWLTYSAFANTQGGVVLLGVREKDGQFSVAGLSNIEKVRTDLFNTLNNPAKVSVNLLTDREVVVRELEGKQVLEVKIPAASRKQKPVFLNGQPLGNTYRRLHEGDRRCSEEDVRRMFAEQVEDCRDERILPNYDFADIDPDSLRIYRQMLEANHDAVEGLALDDGVGQAHLEVGKLGPGVEQRVGERGVEVGLFAGVRVLGQLGDVGRVASVARCGVGAAGNGAIDPGEQGFACLLVDADQVDGLEEGAGFLHGSFQCLLNAGGDVEFLGCTGNAVEQSDLRGQGGESEAGYVTH